MAGSSSILTRRLNLSDEDGKAAVTLGIGRTFVILLDDAVLVASIGSSTTASRPRDSLLL
ncbi:hypothetical protein [Mycobacterium uberis]|uniref:hypothetical protein n=1 Tax=Mycobacterium uberis TaxID=2162698 RepID=UPI001FB291A3|nr:hypothetical protein [Mycobacterium uberis]